jgi:hypothetical protein
MLLLIALTIASALAQSDAAPAGAAISGLVLEAGSRAPIAGAQVMLMPARPGPNPFVTRPRISVTDREGLYELDEIEAGRYRVTVQKSGFVAVNGPDAPYVDLKPGERRAGVNVTLLRGAVIAGRVLDESGEPLGGVQVMAMQRPPALPGGPPMRGNFLIPGGSSAQTNDLGEFRLFGLKPGEYYVQATARFESGGSPARGMTLLPTYFPDTSDLGAAQPISLGAGQTSGIIDIRMIAVPAFQVSGVVLDEAGRPVANAMVRLAGNEPGASPFGMNRWGARTDTSGRFTIDGVTSGSYTLLAIAPVVISGPANRGGAGSAGGGGFTSLEFTTDFAGGTIVGGTVGGAVTTETSNGTTIEFRDDTGTRLPVTIDNANVSGLEVIVRTPVR